MTKNQKSRKRHFRGPPAALVPVRPFAPFDIRFRLQCPLLKMSPPAGEDGGSPRRAAYVKSLLPPSAPDFALCGQDADSLAHFGREKTNNPRPANDRFPACNSRVWLRIVADGDGRRRTAAEGDRIRPCTNDKKFYFFRPSPLHGRPCAVQLLQIAPCRPVRSAWPVPPAVLRIPQ